MSAITTHVLDTSVGRPAAGVRVALSTTDNGSWINLGAGATDADGRARDLLPADHKLSAGTYKLTFETRDYFRARGVDSFFPRVDIIFSVLETTQHFHVPLLLSPYSYSTYRGT